MTLRRLLLLIPILFAAYVFWTWDGIPPEVSWGDLRPAYGKQAGIDLVVSDLGRGLKTVRVEVRQGEESWEVFSEEYRALGWLDQSGTGQRPISVSLKDSKLKAGDFELFVEATDQPVLGFWNHRTEVSKNLVFDAIPPIVRVLSSTHIIRQGGSELVVFESDEELAQSGVEVGERFFRGFPLGSQPGMQVALFALAYDEPTSTSFTVSATDVAGNKTQVRLSLEVLPGRFRDRRIQISDNFIEKVAAEILPRISDVEAGATLEETFLNINNRLRRINHDFIGTLSEKTAPNILWTEPFLQLSGSKAEANFADRRTYFYADQEIDKQTHQGFDLASLARSKVEAANSGRVLFAEYLGIYGNCVILDHGLGLLSLYGHMSAIEVREGDAVQRGQSLGQTGETGLAGGDHLHFSTIVQGVQVTPLEWWDPSWVQLHVHKRLALGESSTESGS